MPPSLNDRWSNIVKNCAVDLTKPINFVNMSDVTKYGGKETRLLTSIGTEDRLPKILKDKGLFILPLSRTQLVIVRGKGFHRLEDITEPVEMHKTNLSFPESLRNSHGETGFLDYAYFTNLLGKFTQRPKLRLGFKGKRRVSFDFHVDALQTLKVKGAQIEVDSSFEDAQKYFIAEAKYKTPSSFNIRQLYYPFKHFLTEMGTKKEIKTLFFVYEPVEEEYRFWEYSFKDPNDIEQIELVNCAKYKIQFSTKEEPLKEYEVKPVQMRAIQANDIFKLMDLSLAVVDGIDDSGKLSRHFGFDVRQSAYYSDAVRTLGFIVMRGNRYALTSVGETYVELPVEERTTFFLRRLVEYPPVNEVIRRIIAGEAVGEKDLQDLVKKHDPTISKSTIPRRAQCIQTWFKFIADKTGYCRVEHGKILPLRRLDSLNGYYK